MPQFLYKLFLDRSELVTDYINSNEGEGNLRTHDSKSSKLRNLGGKDGDFKINRKNWK